MLYLVATPIGNLSDISKRALDVLGEVDMIASEDTRHTGILLHHYAIRKPQVSFHEHNEVAATRRLLALLEEGRSVALLSDAGTPSISDPGFRLVRAAIAADVPVTVIPGPVALIAALVVSGLPAHSFTFRGFPPRKGGPRQTFLRVDAASPHTLIYYESPYRLQAFLRDALLVLGDRPAALANDLTKKFEAVVRGTLSSILANLSDVEHATAGKHAVRGEYTVVIAGCDTPPDYWSPRDADDAGTGNASIARFGPP